jgi:hypothetical protein
MPPSTTTRWRAGEQAADGIGDAGEKVTLAEAGGAACGLQLQHYNAIDGVRANVQGVCPATATIQPFNQSTNQ